MVSKRQFPTDVFGVIEGVSLDIGSVRSDTVYYIGLEDSSLS